MRWGETRKCIARVSENRRAKERGRCVRWGEGTGLWYDKRQGSSPGPIWSVLVYSGLISSTRLAHNLLLRHSFRRAIGKTCEWLVIWHSHMLVNKQISCCLKCSTYLHCLNSCQQRFSPEIVGIIIKYSSLIQNYLRFAVVNVILWNTKDLIFLHTLEKCVIIFSVGESATSKTK